MRSWLIPGVLCGVIGLASWSWANGLRPQSAEQDQRVFELRTYHVAEGKMDALQRRFRDHTNRLLEKQGVKLIGFWTPNDPKLASKQLIWLIAHESRAKADASWKAFVNDPEWKQAFAESEKEGKLVDEIHRVYLDPIDFSPLK